MKGIKKIDENVISAYRSLTITNPNLLDNSNWQVGTLKCDPSKYGLSFKVNSSGDFSFFDASYLILDGTVTSELIGQGEIGTQNLADLCVNNNKIAERTIANTKLQIHTLTDNEMATASITNRALQDECITENKLANECVTSSKLANGCVTYDKLASNSVGTDHIVDSSVTENKLANNAVGTDKIKDGAVTYNKIAPHTILGGDVSEVVINGQLSIVQGNIAQGTITNYNIANYTINSQNLMDGCVLNRCIGDNEIYGSKIRPKAILTAHIADKAVTGAQIASNTITTDNLADRCVTLAKISNEIADVITNAVTYDVNGNVQMLSTDSCNVEIGSADAFGTSMGNGSLRVYGDIRADRVYNMAYSDLAEGYIPGEHLEPGDIVEIREDGKVYKSFSNGIKAAIVGVVSDEYAACYGATKEEILAKEKIPVALVGRVHVKVKGPITIGDEIRINNLPGVGVTWSLNKHVIGTALETIEEEGIHKVLCLVRPN